MKIFDTTFEVKTTADTDIMDITGKVESAIAKSGIADGLATVFIPGSTAAVTTIEYEDGVVEDLKRAIEVVVPRDKTYLHDGKWGDGNGYSHVRAAFLKPSLSIPVKGGVMLLGTWQQVVLLDFDNRPRTRRVVIQVMG